MEVLWRAWADKVQKLPWLLHNDVDVGGWRFDVVGQEGENGNVRGGLRTGVLGLVGGVIAHFQASPQCPNFPFRKSLVGHLN